MLAAETVAEIRRLYYAEHWRIAPSPRSSASIPMRSVGPCAASWEPSRRGRDGGG